jgi:phospholipid/cholesterol/gamma-HCH transport system substrate-binding protein
MEQKREQALVGLFVIIATSVLVATIFAIGGAFGRAGNSYQAYFKNAGGLEPGSVVRYAGIRVGRVEALRIDPNDPRRIEVRFGVSHGVPVKTDSTAKIASLSALGENYLEILPGKQESPLAKAGSTLPSKEFFGISDVADMLNDLGPDVRELVNNLNDRVTELQQTISRVNDLLNDQNRAHLAGTLDNLNGMLAENRPKIRSSLGHIDEASAKLPSTIDQFKQTAKQADETLKKLDATLGENRPDLHASIVQLRQTLDDASELVNQLSRTVNTNSENLDEIVDNVRLATENLRAFTDEIKKRPYTLIRSTAPPEHKPGEGSKP